MLEVKHGSKIRTWGGWYRHDEVFLDGRCIGRFQIRLRNKRIDSTTCHDATSSGVLGSNLQWIIRTEESWQITKQYSSAPFANIQSI